MRYVLIGFAVSVGWFIGKAIIMEIADTIFRRLRQTDAYRNFVNYKKHKPDGSKGCKNRIGFV